MRKRIIAGAHALAVIAIAAVATTPAVAATYPSSAEFGGASHRVDTLDKVRALIQAQHTTGDLDSTLGQLAPADRSYVIRNGITPARTVYSIDGQVIGQSTTGQSTANQGQQALAARMTRRAAKMTPRACTGFYASHDFTAKSFSWAGILLFTWHNEWQWGGGCRWSWIGWHSHHDWGESDSPGWGFDYENLGSTYGCAGCFMLGRETFGHFSFAKFALYDTADLQVQVNANPGWWAWANIVGP